MRNYLNCKRHDCDIISGRYRGTPEATNKLCKYCNEPKTKTTKFERAINQALMKITDIK